MDGTGGARAHRAWLLAVAVSAPWACAALAADLSGRPVRRTPVEWMEEGYRLKAERDVAGATVAFQTARSGGFDPQRVALELAYLSLERGDAVSARSQLSAAASGPDRELASQARAQLEFLPSPTQRDLYADAYGWRGVRGDSRVANAVPTLRLRGHYRPWFDGGPDVYVYAQATRDLASQGGRLPRLYSDNYALLGPGIQLPLWERRLAIFLQAGVAIDLVDDGRPLSAFDARGGALLGLESGGCSPAPAEGARLRLAPCADAYGEAVWLNRFQDDLVLFARGRAGANWLVTGPVAWQVLAEGRGSADRNGQNGDAFLEGGAWHRWRLLRPVRVDALAGVDVGRTLEIGGRRPVRPGTYAELRFQLVTYAEF